MKKVRHGIKYDLYELAEIIALVIVMILLTWGVLSFLVYSYT